MKTSTHLLASMWLATCLLDAGCVTRNPLHADPRLLDFLQDGQTRKEDVLLKLGQPSATLESEKFATYRLGHDEKLGYWLIEKRPVGWEGIHYNLVLVFDAQGKLARHALVEVH